MATLRIRNGEIVDGTGAAPFSGELLLENGTIREIVRTGEQLPETDRELDARGLTVSPGFIDMHSHMDFVLPAAQHDALARNFLQQGVTTVIAGNCGLSPAPIRSQTRQLVEDHGSILIDEALDWSWSSVGEYLDRLDDNGLAINVAQLVGHGTVRHAASDKRRGPLSPSDLDRCRGLLRDTFDQGACGLSFGLGYDPGMYSPLEELEEFARVAGEANRAVTVHLKAYSKISPTYPLTELKAHNIRALREMLHVADDAGVRLQISHLIFVGRRTWPTARAALDLIDDARSRGRDVMIDAFPYTCGNTTINATIPYWFLAMGPRAFRSRLARMRLRVETAAGFRLVGFGWEDFQIMESGVGQWSELNGKFLPEIAEKWSVSPFNAWLTIAERTDGGALMLFHGYSGDREGNGPIEDVLTHEACLYETDAVVRSSGWPNPAAVGTFPKILGEYVRERGRFTLQEAVHRMSGAGAARFGIGDRGTLEVGKAADIVIFDAGEISDTPGGSGQPPGRPKGIRSVLLNGVEVVRDGRVLDAGRNGRVLRT